MANRNSHTRIFSRLMNNSVSRQLVQDDNAMIDIQGDCANRTTCNNIAITTNSFAMSVTRTTTYPQPPRGEIDEIQHLWLNWFVLLSAEQRRTFLRDRSYAEETIEAIDMTFTSHNTYVRRARNRLRSQGYTSQDFTSARPLQQRCDVDQVPRNQRRCGYGEQRCPECPESTWRQNTSGWQNMVSSPRPRDQSSIPQLNNRTFDHVDAILQIYNDMRRAGRLPTASGTQGPGDGPQAGPAVVYSLVPVRPEQEAELRANGHDIYVRDGASGIMTRTAWEEQDDDEDESPIQIQSQSNAGSQSRRRPSQNTRYEREQLVQGLLNSVPASWTEQTTSHVELDEEGLPALPANDGNLIHTLRREVASGVQRILHG